MRRWFWALIPLMALGWAARVRLHEMAPARDGWKPIASGIEMRRFNAVEDGYAAPIIAFRVAPSRLHIAGSKASFEAADWRRREGAVVAINGGFFDAQGHSLGLRIADGKRLSALHGTRWSVFRCKNGQAAIISASDVAAALKRGVRYQQAVQCGPTLVNADQIGTFKPQWARRSGLGIARDGQVIVAIADAQLSLQAWAHVFRDQLHCPNALNLDGGPSTQLSLRAPQSTLEIRSGRVVPDAVIIR